MLLVPHVSQAAQVRQPQSRVDDVEGDISNVTVGAGLSRTGGTLTATVAPAGWNLTGNAGTNPATNYIGTTDAQPLVLRTGALERIRVSGTGQCRHR